MTTDTTLAKEKLATDFRNVMSDIEALMKATASQAEGEATMLRARIGERLDAAKGQISELQRDAVERAKRAAGAADGYVHEHPWQAIGVAAAVGVMLGMLIGRR